jgi:hypothetical protein
MNHKENISVEDNLSLDSMKKIHAGYMPRMRSHSTLLSETGYEAQELSGILGICIQNTALWLSGWAKSSMIALLEIGRTNKTNVVN